jgi:hypothetical protein
MWRKVGEMADTTGRIPLWLIGTVTFPTRMRHKLTTPKLVFLAFPTNNKTHSMCTRMVFLSLSILTELDLSYPEESAYSFFSSS